MYSYFPSLSVTGTLEEPPGKSVDQNKRVVDLTESPQNGGQGTESTGCPGASEEVFDLDLVDLSAQVTDPVADPVVEEWLVEMLRRVSPQEQLRIKGDRKTTNEKATGTRKNKRKQPMPEQEAATPEPPRTSSRGRAIRRPKQ